MGTGIGLAALVAVVLGFAVFGSFPNFAGATPESGTAISACDDPGRWDCWRKTSKACRLDDGRRGVVYVFGGDRSRRTCVRG